MTSDFPMLNHDILWESYRTARAESIAAQQSMRRVLSWSMTVGAIVIAGLAFLRGQQNPPFLTPIVAWVIIAALGLLSSSQYMGELGRMLRAGFYARQIERAIWRQTESGGYSSNLMWEGFLTLPKRRLHWTYRGRPCS